MKILLLETIHKDAARLLAETGEIVLAERLDADYLAGAIKDAAAALTRGRGRLPRQVLLAGRSSLRAVARCGVGTDNVDVATATELGIPVIYAPGSTTATVAEHALMLMLAVARRLTRFDRAVRAGNWALREQVGEQVGQLVGLGVELNGKTLGVLGLGDTGRRTAELGGAFGMNVAYWSRTSRDARFQYLELEELLARADVLSINLALTPETKGFLNQGRLALMKPAAILINTARGEVLDEAALYEKLASGKLAGAGLDVIAADAPHGNHPLWSLENVVVTPHVAALTDVAFRRMCIETAEQVVRILRGGEPDPRFVRNSDVLLRREKNTEHNA